VVIRVLDSSKVQGSLESMGLDASELDRMHGLIDRPQGIVLVTGPTGAGKTSTLYGMLASLHSVERNIATIEDPIEYELEGINQTNVQDKIGLTFGGMLRALLRQDPDVIMLGEMRDAETTNIALQASITGHLVLSTMHTSNAVATVTRLRNIGVPSYVIASAVNGIIAQRLVRAVCQHCKKPAEPTEADVARLGSLANMATLQSFAGSGCVMCNGTGYKGRTGIFEILAFSPTIRELVAADAPELQIRREALATGMQTLLTAALNKVNAGRTTLAEVFRVIELDEVDHGAAEECPSCGSVTEPEFLACPVCACRLAPACPSCERKVMEHWKACPYCCVRLDEPQETAKASAARGGKRSAAPTLVAAR
jgi:type IV pilus assembly protein PilB